MILALRSGLVWFEDAHHRLLASLQQAQSDGLMQPLTADFRQQDG